MRELKRIRWRCRRGLLELDILLNRFVEKYYLNLDEMQQTEFDSLLDMPDPLLWEAIANSKSNFTDGGPHAVLELLQTV